MQNLVHTCESHALQERWCFTGLTDEISRICEFTGLTGVISRLAREITGIISGLAHEITGQKTCSLSVKLQVYRAVR